MARKKQMKMFHCNVTKEAKERVNEVINSGQLSEGEVVKEFEKQLEQKLGLANPVCTNSGTSALHLALKVLGVGPGDEVIVPANTFIATGMVVFYCGARPVVVDIDPDTGCIDLDAVLDAISPMTKAVIPVHYGGLICPGIRDFDPYCCPVIEDSAHVMGGATGRGWEISMFSLQATKQLTSGDGGVVCFPRIEDVDYAKRLRWFGFDRQEPIGEDGLRENDDGGMIGFKYHMNNVAAAIGLGNLQTFDPHANDWIVEEYYKGLEGIPDLQLTPRQEGRVYYFFSILVKKGSRLLLNKLYDNGCACSLVNRGLDEYKVFQPCKDLPGMNQWRAEHIALPVHGGLTKTDVRKIVKTIKGGWR